MANDNKTPENSISELVEAAFNAFEPSANRTPQRGDWGFYAYNDAPPAFCGAGLGGFYWFESRAEMAKCLAEHGAFLSPGIGEEDLGPVLEIVREIGTRLGDGRIDGEKARTALNKVLEDITQFSWIGSFEGLLSGDSEFARELRQEFREQQEAIEDFDEPGDDQESGKGDGADDLGAEVGRQAAINEEEIDEFIEFLELYGT